jgi:uncharacterized FAD-dependent dehydrogenase
MYDIVLIGAGPSNITCANYLIKNNINNFVIIDIGKDIGIRDHDLGLDCVHGLGGAGLFSDGKFSFYPSGTYIWEKFNQEDLAKGYVELKNILNPYIELPELFDNSNEIELNQIELTDSKWKLKNYSLLIEYLFSLIKNKIMLSE